MSTLVVLCKIRLKSCVLLVVSTERLVLWRSEIFGGISNEISAILDKSTLPRDMKSMPFGSDIKLFLFNFSISQRKATWTG